MIDCVLQFGLLPLCSIVLLLPLGLVVIIKSTENWPLVIQSFREQPFLWGGGGAVCVIRLLNLLPRNFKIQLFTTMSIVMIQLKLKISLARKVRLG